MGYASYLENIRELRDHLASLANDFRDQLPALDSAGVKGGHMLRAAISRLESIAEQVTALIELATDPKVDLAYKVGALESQSQALARRVSELEASLQSRDAELKAKRTQVLRLKRDLQDFEDAKTGAIYDEYVSPEMIKKHKPDK